MDDLNKRCHRCYQDRPVAEFYRHKRSRDGLHYWCKDCSRSYSREYHHTNRGERLVSMRAYRHSNRFIARTPEQAKASKLACVYRWTHERYVEMLRAQDGRCAICRQPETDVSNKSGKVRQLSLDHDHSCCPGTRSCGKCVRGLLCHRCNMALGLFKDDPDRLQSAFKYLTNTG